MDADYASSKRFATRGLSLASQPSQDAAIQRFTLEHLDVDSVRVMQNGGSNSTMTRPGTHDPTVRIDPVAEKTAAALQRTAIAFFNEDQHERRDALLR